MSQHDFEITNADANTGLSMRAAINAALQALATLSSGATEPETPYAYQWWADTTSGYLKIRNATNTAWISIGPLSNLIALSGLLAAQGDIPYAIAANLPAALAKGAADTRLFMNAAGILPEWAIGVYVGSFTRDMTAPSGNYSNTGPGFKPRYLLFFAAGPNMPGMSIGAANVSMSGCIYDLHVDIADSWAASTSRCIYLRTSGGTSQDAYLASLDANGFTLTWTKTGAPPAGNAIIIVIAIR